MPVPNDHKHHLVASPEQRARWQRAADETERSFSAWVRYHLDRAASLDLQQHGIRDEFPTERRQVG